MNHLIQQITTLERSRKQNNVKIVKRSLEKLIREKFFIKNK